MFEVPKFILDFANQFWNSPGTSPSHAASPDNNQLKLKRVTVEPLICEPYNKSRYDARVYKNSNGNYLKIDTAQERKGGRSLPRPYLAPGFTSKGRYRRSCQD